MRPRPIQHSPQIAQCRANVVAAAVRAASNSGRIAAACSGKSGERTARRIGFISLRRHHAGECAPRTLVNSPRNSTSVASGVVCITPSLPRAQNVGAARSVWKRTRGNTVNASLPVTVYYAVNNLSHHIDGDGQ